MVVEDLGLGDVLDADLVDPAPGHRLHRTPPLGATLGPRLQERPAGGRRPLAVRCGVDRQHLAHLDELLGPAQRGPQVGLRVAAASAGRASAARGRWSRSRAASSVPLPPGAGRTRTSIRSPNSASGAGSARGVDLGRLAVDGHHQPPGRRLRRRTGGRPPTGRWPTGPGGRPLPPARAASDATFPSAEVMPGLPRRRAAGRRANSCTMRSQKAGRSSGDRLVVMLPSVTTSSSTTSAPALRRSVRTLGHEVSRRPRATSASTKFHGPWQIEATGLPDSTKSRTKLHRGRVPSAACPGSPSRPAAAARRSRRPTPRRPAGRRRRCRRPRGRGCAPGSRRS